MRYWLASLLLLNPLLAQAPSTPSAVVAPVPSYEIIEDKATTPLLNPSMQKRQIVKLRLKNGVRAYLISDPETKHSAASVAVNRGSWNDPKAYPGMAHFVEHLLFMGSKAYPVEADFSQFIATHGGHQNAFTATDRTVYMFSTNHEGFPDALNRFAHFFIDPLLNLSSIERELHAVDQEHAKNIEHDGWRQWMVLKETGNQEHPHASFSTGNADTLGGIPQEAVRSWFQENYTADNLCVVMVSPLPKDKLIELAVRDFSDVAPPAPGKAAVNSQGTMLSDQQRGHLLYIKPVRNLRELALIWEVPQQFDRQQKQDLLSLLTYLLNSEHDGGLASQLKKDQLAENTRAGFLNVGEKETIFSVEIELTDQGVQNPDRVIEKVFAALALLRDTQTASSFAEMRQLATLHYQYETRKNAFEFVTEYGRNIFDEDFATFPEKKAIPQNFDQTLFSQLISNFSPTACAFVLTADPAAAKIEPDHRERWMGAEYALRNLSKDKLTAWSNAKSGTLALAPPNMFIPAQLQLLPAPSDEATEPTILQQSEKGRLFFARDAFYQVPETAANFRIYSALLDGSPRAIVMAQLFSLFFQENVASTICMADAAGLHTSLSPAEHYLALSFHGYSEKMLTLVKDLFEKLPKVSPSREQFAIYHKKLEMEIANAAKDMPINQAKEVVNNILLSSAPTHQQKLEAIRKVSYEDFLEFSSNLFAKVYSEAFVYGNCSEEEARSYGTALENALQAKAFPRSDIVQRKVRVFSENTGPFVVVEPTETMGKATILVIQQGPRYFTTHAAQLLSNAVLHELFFDILRTKQQTAYIAGAQAKEIEGQLLQLFLVQSNSHQPQELLARFELFVEDFLKNFDENLPQERFEILRAMLVKEFTLPPENLQLQAARLAKLAFDYQEDFLFYPKLVDSLEAIDRQHVKAFLETTLSRKNTRRLAVLIEGKLPHDFSYKRLAKEELQSLGDLETRHRR